MRLTSSELLEADLVVTATGLKIEIGGWAKIMVDLFFFSSRRRHTRLQGDWSQTCALPISRTCYGEGVLALRREVRAAGGPALRRDEIAMVGDDVRSDVRAAQRAGLRGVFVLSGKHGPADVEAAARERGGRRPDAIAASLAEVVAALD